MILLSKASGGIVFKDGKDYKTLKAGGTLKVNSKEVAERLMKMYKGIVVEVDTEEASDDTTIKGNRRNKNNKKEGGNNDDTTDPK